MCSATSLSGVRVSPKENNIRLVGSYHSGHFWPDVTSYAASTIDVDKGLLLHPILVFYIPAKSLSQNIRASDFRCEGGTHC